MRPWPGTVGPSLVCPVPPEALLWEDGAKASGHGRPCGDEPLGGTHVARVTQAEGPTLHGCSVKTPENGAEDGRASCSRIRK